jgi:hypothetical protein
MLLGSFFFVHRSKAKQKGDAPEQYEESSAFEFLHNTFGEFLTADFILRQALAETESLAALSASESLRTDLQRKLDVGGRIVKRMVRLPHIYSAIFAPCGARNAQRMGHPFIETQEARKG